MRRVRPKVVWAYRKVLGLTVSNRACGCGFLTVKPEGGEIPSSFCWKSTELVCHSQSRCLGVCAPAPSRRLKSPQRGALPVRLAATRVGMRCNPSILSGVDPLPRTSVRGGHRAPARRRLARAFIVRMISARAMPQRPSESSHADSDRHELSVDGGDTLRFWTRALGLRLARDPIRRKKAVRRRDLG